MLAARHRPHVSFSFWEEHLTMLRRTLLALTAASAALAFTAPSAFAEGKTFYWISHGGPADPVWTYFLQGAELWAADTGNTVNTSFFSGDVAAQQEAIRSAVAAGADGIVTTSPDPGSLVEVVDEVNAAGIPIINFNTSDAAVAFPAYVGNDLFTVGQRWAQYLVDNGHVEAGDFVWMPVEVPGASYGVEEEKGIASVFEPLGVTWEVTDATLDQAEVITRMSDYLLANRENISAIIGLGDMVTGSIQRVFDQVGVAPGEIPVVGWGNSLDTTKAVMDGYVNAAMWQDPQAQSYVALSLAAMMASGVPVGFNVTTGALYEADTAAVYHAIMGGS
jgi:simple sugar transport system substrate-binding protein